MEELREKLINAQKQGVFLKVLQEAYVSLVDDIKSIGKEIAVLNNEGVIDAIAEFRQLLRNSNGTDFFLIRHVFEDALPEINAPVPGVMDCVEHLFSEAENDMAAGWLFTPFIKYCEADINRPGEVLKIAESSRGKWLNFIASAIVAGSNLQLSKYVLVAIALTRHENLQVRIRAVLALGRINYCNEISLLTDALAALESVIRSEDDDCLLGEGLKSAFSLYVADNNVENNVVRLAKVALASKGDFTLQAASQLLGFDTDKIPAALLDVLLDALENTKPHNKDVLDNIDFGLLHLLKTSQEEIAISFLEHLLVRNNSDLGIEVFNSLTHELSTNWALLNKLVTRWFLSRKTSLCRAIMDIVGVGFENDIVLHADTLQFKERPEGTCLFATRKAIGWLFTSPVSCTSFIVALIDASSQDETEEITDLLFDPLLISYPGKVKDYLESILPDQSPKVQDVLNNSLVRLENYHSGIKSAWNIPELLPSQAQRETHLRLINRQFANSFKEAQKNSIINLICSKSVLLYGRKSINYVHYPNAQTHRMETPLQSFGHSIEFPSLENIDPHRLEYMLRVFRLEECTQ